jgi:hypothetical protein
MGKVRDKCKYCSGDIYRRTGDPLWFHTGTRDCWCDSAETNVASPLTHRYKWEEFVRELWNIGDIHGLWHEFKEKFLIITKESDDYKFRLAGYKLMKGVDQWARKHSEVKIVLCDDKVYATSYMVLVPHCTKTKWHGITCVSIPQLAGDPSIMFWYPRNTELLVKAIGVLEEGYDLED